METILCFIFDRFHGLQAVLCRSISNLLCQTNNKTINNKDNNKIEIENKTKKRKKKPKKQNKTETKGKGKSGEERQIKQDGVCRFGWSSMCAYDMMSELWKERDKAKRYHLVSVLFVWQLLLKIFCLCQWLYLRFTACARYMVGGKRWGWACMSVIL